MSDGRRDSRRERPDEFGSSGRGRLATYQGERRVGPEGSAIDVTPAKALAKPKLRRQGLSWKEAQFLQALVGSGTLIEAWRKAFPNDPVQYAQQRQKAHRYHQRILAKLGGEDGMFESMGIGRQATMEKLRQLKDAKVVKAFIVPETGEVVEAGPYDDNTTQMAATKLLAQVHKMVDSEKGGPGGQVIVNVIQYSAPGAPPWPGSGRS